MYVHTVRGYLPASEDIKDNLMGVDREQEELQQLYQLKQVCIRSNSLYNIGQDFNEICKYYFIRIHLVIYCKLCMDNSATVYSSDL